MRLALRIVLTPIAILVELLAEGWRTLQYHYYQAKKQR